jgi:hypothetical protein
MQKVMCLVRKDKTVNTRKPQLWVDGLLRCDRVEHRNRNRHTHDQNTAVLPIPLNNPIGDAHLFSRLRP